MTRTNSTPGPQPERQRAVYRALRKEILTGAFGPGQRLPTRRSLQESFDAAPLTVDRAVGRLIEAGFCEARGRLGTFVADHPPHLCRYGMLFPINSPPQKHSTFYDGLEKIAEQISGRDQRFQVAGYHGVYTGTPSEEYQQLLEDLHHHRLAGLITCVPTHVLPQDAILKAPGVPQVGVMPRRKDEAFPTIAPDYTLFLEMALDRLKERGCRRIGFIQIGLQPDHGYEAIARACADRGLITQPAWYQAVSWQESSHAVQVAQLLMFSRDPLPPDGFLIADDHLVEPATEGFRRAGCEPGTLELVAHCNEPFRPRARLPVHWLGFDLTDIMMWCFEAIDRQRNGETVASEMMPPRFGSETS